MDNALFYTLSTIAQALSAAFALLGAFVLFRLQQLSAACANAGAIVIRPYLPNQEARRLLAIGSFAKLAQYLISQQVQRPGAIGPHTLEAARDAFGKSIAQREQLLSQLLHAMLATGAVIALAVTGLAVTPQIGASAQGAYAVLTAAVIALVGCLVMYGRIIWAATSDA
jgi:hypothetical protein